MTNIPNNNYQSVQTHKAGYNCARKLIREIRWRILKDINNTKI